jgi:outer membrane receptor protein involved in Fe transport
MRARVWSLSLIVVAAAPAWAAQDPQPQQRPGAPPEPAPVPAPPPEQPAPPPEQPAPAPEQPAPPPPQPAPAQEEEVVGGAPAPQGPTTPRSQTESAFSGNKRTVEEEIVVTGSRIRRKDLTGPAPVVVYSREQVQATGRVNVGEFLQTIPEQSNAIGRATNNGGTGSIRVSLRGIGPQATLVLLNGHRVAPGGTGADNSVDLSAIPTNVIERIEILKDGASAIYGSDAIGGVINIITRKRMEGGDISILGGTSSRLDGNTVDMSGMLGATSEHGSFLISGNFYNAGAVMADARGFSQEQKIFDSTTGKVTTLGSGTIPNGRIVLPASQAGMQNGNAAWNSLVGANPMATSFTRDASGMWRPFAGSGLTQDGFNYQPFNYLITPQKRFNVFLTGEYHLGSAARVYVDSFYTKRNSAQTLAPEPLVLDTEGVTVSAANVYNPFGRDFDAVRRRLLEFGDRHFQQDIHNFHLVSGVDGTTPQSWGPLRGWFWDASFNFSSNESTELKTGNLRLTKLRDAVGPSYRDQAGAVHCGTPGTTVEGCVPLNLFGPEPIGKEQIDPLTFDGVQRGTNQMMGAQFNTSGDLFHLFAERPVGLALGYEFRNLEGGQIPDPLTVAGEVSGNKGLITHGSYHVNEVYGEMSIPVIDKRPGAEVIELVAATRASFYSDFGTTANYKLGGRWSPVADVALRGTYSTAFRAPSIPDLYGGESDAFANVSDPCQKDVNPQSPRGAACGAAANNGDDQTQLKTRVGGYDKLRPEKAKVITLGTVIEPRWVKGLYITADYFHTKIRDSINPLGGNVILQSCYPDATGVMPKYCEFITRDPTTQRITEIKNLNANVGSDELDGADITAGYDFVTGAGRWGVQLVAAYLHNYDRTLADGTLIKGAGTWDLNAGGSGGAYPHLRFNANVGWALGGFAAGIRTYLIGGFRECGDSDGVMEGNGLCYDPSHVGERHVPAYNTWDITLAYGWKNMAGQTGLSIGVINLFDQVPAVVYNGFANTTDTFSYDPMMRQFFARLTHRF